jgi:hypothetical protein
VTATPAAGWQTAMLAALVAVLDQPRWWAIALAGFLVRGGWLVLLVALVELPSPAGLANLLGPTVVAVVLGEPSVELALLALAAVGLVLAALVGTTLLGTWLELGLVAEAAASEEVGLARAVARPDLWRAAGSRLVAHLPSAVVLAWATVRVGEATYAELIGPGDAAVPVILRVLSRVPEAVLAAVAVWLVGEAVGGAAVRRLAAGDGQPAALARGLLAVLGRRSGLATLAISSLAVFVCLGLVLVASRLAWLAVRTALVGGGAGLEATILIGLLSVVWLAGLWTMALVVAWRGVAWTAEVHRRPV